MYTYIHAPTYTHTLYYYIICHCVRLVRKERLLQTPALQYDLGQSADRPPLLEL